MTDSALKKQPFFTFSTANAPEWHFGLLQGSRRFRRDIHETFILKNANNSFVTFRAISYNSFSKSHRHFFRKSGVKKVNKKWDAYHDAVYFVRLFFFHDLTIESIRNGVGEESMIAVCNQMSCGGSGLALHPLRFTFCYPHSLFLCKQLKPAEMQLDRLGLWMKMRLSNQNVVLADSFCIQMQICVYKDYHF